MKSGRECPELARRVVLLPQTIMVAIGIRPDMGRRFALIASGAHDPKQTSRRPCKRLATVLPRLLVPKRLATDRSRFRFDFNPTRQSHKPAFRWCYCGVCPTGSEIKHVYDRASDVFLP
jgi:hypothetical protein